MGSPPVPIWSFFAIKELMDGIEASGKARKIGDAEGVRRANSRTVRGAVNAIGSSTYISGKVIGSVAPGLETAVLGIGYVSNILFGAGAMISMGLAGLGMLRCQALQQQN